MNAAQPQIDQPFCALCRTPLDPDTPPGRKVCDGCMAGSRSDVLSVAEQPPTPKLWKCRHICGRILPRTSDNFYRDRKMADGFQSWCKQCDLEKKHERKRRAKTNTAQVVKPFRSIVLNADPQLAPNSTIVVLDLSSYPDLLAYLTDLSRDQERSLEGQIRWILRQCHKHRAEIPSAACGEV